MENRVQRLKRLIAEHYPAYINARIGMINDPLQNTSRLPDRFLKSWHLAGKFSRDGLATNSLNCLNFLRALGLLRLAEKTGTMVDDARTYESVELPEDEALVYLEAHECWAFASDCTQTPHGSYPYILKGVNEDRQPVRLHTCPHCESEAWARRSELHSVEMHDSAVCSDCYHESFRHCRECGECHHDDDVRWAEQYDAYVCDSCFDHYYCYNEMDEIRRTDDVDDEPVFDRDSVMNYSTDVLNHLPAMLGIEGEKLTPRSLLFGVELEVLPRRNAPADIARLAHETVQGFAVLKSDSSLDTSEGGSDTGFEIVSCPATLRAHRKGWKTFFSKHGPTQYLRSYNTRVCGIHVHVNRAAFSGRLHIARFERFVNAPENIDFIKAIAGRDSSRWAKTNPGKKIKESHQGIDMDRYVAVNQATRGKKTIEVRIFRGNIDPVGFFKNLEFVSALFEFTARCGFSDAALHVDSFMGWLFKPENQGKYRTLAYWLTHRSKYFTKAYGKDHTLNSHIPVWTLAKAESNPRAAA